MLKSFAIALVSALALVSSVAGARQPAHHAAPPRLEGMGACQRIALTQQGRPGETYQVCEAAPKAAPVRRVTGETTFRGSTLGGAGHDVSAPRLGTTVVLYRAGR